MNDMPNPFPSSLLPPLFFPLLLEKIYYYLTGSCGIMRRTLLQSASLIVLRLLPPRIRNLPVCPRRDRVFNLFTLTQPCGATFHWSTKFSIDAVRLGSIRCASYLAVAVYLEKVLSSSFAPTSTWRGWSHQCRIQCSNNTYYVHALAIKA